MGIVSSFGFQDGGLRLIFFFPSLCAKSFISLDLPLWACDLWYLWVGLWVLWVVGLVGCGEKPVDVNLNVEQDSKPVVVQTCDADCQKVLEHREQQRQMGLGQAYK